MDITKKNIFAERERALENEFFYKLDKRLLENLRRKLADEETKMALAMAGHISGEALLDELVELGVKPESLAAVNLIPMVLVAWANHEVAEKERLTVLQAAAGQGMHEEDPAYELLEHWLRVEPGRNLGDAWKHYIQELSGTLTDQAKAALRDEIMSRATTVAQSAHGILGFGRIAEDERRVLDQLEQAFAEP